MSLLCSSFLICIRHISRTSSFTDLQKPTGESKLDALSPSNAKSMANNVVTSLKLNERYDYERLKLDFKLKEADNRFLQEELENKDKMLAMLTEGLKEVGNEHSCTFIF